MKTMAACVIKRFPKSLLLANLKYDVHGCLMLTASLKLKVPPNYDHVVYPERRRLKIMEKIPPLDAGVRPPKMMKDLHLMRGPETVHNKLQYGDYGIQAVTGGRLKHKDCEAIRMIIVRQMDERNMFAMWRITNLWQSVTKKGQGQRMGGGKGSIDHYVFPLKAERMIIEVGGECEFVEVYPMLKAIQKILPFRSRVVTHESLAERETREKLEEERNLNPFTFKYCAQNNVMGCQKFLNRYDNMWYGKYR
ncbi:39S ribosomal protein L16, mitochondrial [Aplysia californica]|uniref:Large ribosomal subunit protein uL16m n=1 Tax=Aplysia californica TaxID=6500 RepID=A0ABM0K4C6_APLCA|nr:39S ribosomal protein L16, mitochondrial [Aplysia californica]